MKCGDDGIINKWLVRRVSQGIPNFSTLVQKWSRLAQYSRLAKKREELLGCAIAIFYSSHPTWDHLHDLSSMSKSKFWGKCLSRFKLKGRVGMRKRKKRLQKWPLWRVRVWESISSMFLPTFLPKVASLPCNTGQNKGQYWENALWLYGMYCMLSRDLMDISFGKWSGSSRWTGLLQRGQSRATLFCCKWSRSSKWTGLLQKGRTRTTTFLLQMIWINF